jgi:hypothetical protein
MEVREEHAKLRKYFAELSAALRDPRVPTKKRLRQVRALETALKQLHAQIEDCAVARFSASGGYVINGAGGLVEAGFGLATGDNLSAIKGGATALANALGVGLKNAPAMRVAWRLEPLSA